MTHRLIDALATTDEMAAVFADAAIVDDLLQFEIGLAAALAECGVIPEAAAAAIAESAGPASAYDAAALALAARGAATPVLALVEQLTARVARVDPSSARYVHFGTTSQDVADTALVLGLGRARPIVAAGHRRLVSALVSLSERHAATVMLGRTLLQPGPPVTFGLKVALWCQGIAVAGVRLLAAFDAARRLQFGGAVGTRAALGGRGEAVARALAARLGLPEVVTPWHTERDRLSALVAATGLYVAALGKMARDVSLLMQDEVGEVRERGGGSSTMPQKRNPSASAIILAAATRLPALVAASLAGAVQEHERGLGGWQAEWPTIVTAVETLASALDAAGDQIEHLEVFPDRMRDNINRTRGTVFAERVTLSLTPALGRDAAKRLVVIAIERARSGPETFGEAVRAIPEIVRTMTPEDLSAVDRPEAYLGAAEQLRRRVIESLPAEA